MYLGHASFVLDKWWQLVGDMMVQVTSASPCCARLHPTCLQSSSPPPPPSSSSPPPPPPPLSLSLLLPPTHSTSPVVRRLLPERLRRRCAAELPQVYYQFSVQTPLLQCPISFVSHIQFAFGSVDARRQGLARCRRLRKRPPQRRP
jgi:hypothetical protein